jgi:hypothetical protein
MGGCRDMIFQSERSFELFTWKGIGQGPQTKGMAAKETIGRSNKEKKQQGGIMSNNWAQFWSILDGWLRRYDISK